jgi:hypothetical protein
MSIPDFFPDVVREYSTACDRILPLIRATPATWRGAVSILRLGYDVAISTLAVCLLDSVNRREAWKAGNHEIRVPGRG